MFPLGVIANAVLGVVTDECKIDVRKADPHSPFQEGMFEPSVKRKSQLACFSINQLWIKGRIALQWWSATDNMLRQSDSSF